MNPTGFKTIDELKSALTQYALWNGNLTLKGLAWLCNVDPGSIIKKNRFNSKSLITLMTDINIKADQCKISGFPPIASLLVIKYFAKYARSSQTCAGFLYDYFGPGEIKKMLVLIKNRATNESMREKPSPKQTQIKFDKSEYMNREEPYLKIGEESIMLTTPEVNALIGDPFEKYVKLIKKICEVENGINDRTTAAQICALLVKDFAKDL